MAARYRVMESLGSGGMGDVYRAWDEEGGCQVALKMLRTKHMPNSSLRQRFSREIDILTRVTHHNVVQVFDAGFHREQAFFTMEHIDGKTLRQHLASGRLSAYRSLQIVAAIADGLRAVHDVGVIHRDIKAENILVDNRGTAKLMDFGLAILEKHTDATRLTGVGQIVGTLCCLPPEILQNEEYTVRSDVFQLGMVLYECVTGQAPWEQTDMHKLISGESYKTVKKPSEICSDIPKGVDELVMKALAVNPEERYESAAQFRDALMSWLDKCGQTETVRRRYVSSRMKAIKGAGKKRKRETSKRAGMITRAFPALVPVLRSSLLPYFVVSLLCTIGALFCFDSGRAMYASEEVFGQKGSSEAKVAVVEEVNGESCSPSAPAIHRAVWDNDEIRVRRLLQKPHVLKDRDMKGNSALHYALHRNRRALAELLIAAGADVNVCNEDGISPMHEAAALGNSGLVNVLLAAGAKVNVRGSEGDTPLFWARCKGHAHIVQLLEAQGAK